MFFNKGSSVFSDLRDIGLESSDWDALQVFKEILEVCLSSTCLELQIIIFNLFKIPHAFQQWLSYEKTPTLCHAIPAFEAMLNIWQRYQQSQPETADIVENGLDKLRDYIDRLDNVPAYTIAMGNLFIMIQVSSPLTDY